MITDIFEYKKHKGTPDDIRFRKATEDEADRCRKAETLKGMSIPGAILMVVISIIVAIYLCTSFGELPYIIVSAVFVIVAIGGLIFRVCDYKKSETYEIAEGKTVMVMHTNKRKYAAVWCETDEVYLPKLRFLSITHLYTDTPLYIVKGNRGEGKKPHYFVIAAPLN